MRRIAHGLTFPVLAKESSVWMLRFAQHDKGGVIPGASEESSAWMLHCATLRSTGKPLTLSLRDVPLLFEGEGRFGNAETG